MQPRHLQRWQCALKYCALQTESQEAMTLSFLNFEEHACPSGMYEMATSAADTACAAGDSEGAAVVAVTVGVVAAVDISGATVVVATSRGKSDAFANVTLLLGMGATSEVLVTLLAAVSTGVADVAGVSAGMGVLLFRSAGLSGWAMMLEVCGSMKFEASAVHVLLCDE